MNKTERKGIRASLIKSYEILEEKLNQNNEIISELEKELSGGYQKEKKGKKEKTRSVGPETN